MNFLILSRAGESDAIPITGLLDITVPRGIQKDPNITKVLEGKSYPASNRTKDIDTKLVKGFIYEVDQTIMILNFERLLHAS